MGKGAGKGGSRRGQTAANIARHSTQCTICKHPQKQEIEARYLAFVSVLHVADEFKVSDDAVLRHADYFGLSDQRVSDTEKVLKNVIARGFAQHKEIAPTIAMAAVQELNKMQGKLKAPETHPNDVARNKREELKRWFEEQGILESHANN